MKYTSGKVNGKIAVYKEDCRKGLHFVRASNTERFLLVNQSNGNDFYRVFRDGEPFFGDRLFLMHTYDVSGAEPLLNKNRFVHLFAAVHRDDVYICRRLCIVDTLCGSVPCIFNESEFDSGDYGIFENVLYARKDKAVVYLPSMEIVYEFSSLNTRVIADESETFVVIDDFCTRDGNLSAIHKRLVEIDKKTGNTKIIYG
jgi:hypothetical protein